MIGNARRVALGIFSGKIIFNDCKTARPRLRSNESPSGAFKRQNVLAGARWRGLAPTSSAGLAVLLFHGKGAMANGILPLSAAQQIKHKLTRTARRVSDSKSAEHKKSFSEATWIFCMEPNSFGVTRGEQPLVRASRASKVAGTFLVLFWHAKENVPGAML